VFRLGYNTNGLAHHRLPDALPMLAELGYEAVAITPDVGQLDPYRLDPVEVREVRREAERLGLALAIETGARFLLDPRRKHQPSLLDPRPEERARRLDFLRRCLALAEALGAGLVSLWSGSAPDAPSGAGDRPAGGSAEAVWERLLEGLQPLIAEARERGLTLGFEPEPGMFVERPAGFLELERRLGSEGEGLGLTLDVGHLLVTGDLPVEAWIRRLASRLVHVHLDDIARGVHLHLPFGQGDLDLPAALKALLEVGYRGIAAVELSRDSHRGAEAAEEALLRLRVALGPES
jgi:L-ribulose-5-phosphate 3-epimerase